MRILSGIQTSGELHLGNYFGALRQHVAFQDRGEALYFLADYHSMTTIRDAAERRRLAYEMALDYLACGLDPERAILYRQSDLPEVCELAWILSTLTPMGLLERAHAYKDARQNNQEVNHGLFAYPVLMAADILIYDSHEVPVGKDQKQHLEMTRDIAQRFNHIYGDTFLVPEPRIAEEVATIPGIDGRKMSKSYNNVIPLFSTEKQLRKTVMRIVTDSKSVEEPKDPDTCNVFQIFRQFADEAQQAHWAQRYRDGGMGYGEIKQATFEAINERLKPLRERYFAVREDRAHLEAILAEGGRRAREVARGVVHRARKRMGLS